MYHLIKHRKFIHSRLFYILLISLVWMIADAALEFTFPTRLESLHMNFFQIGLLLSLASISGLLVDLPLGLLSEKFSIRRIMVTGLIFSIISAAFIFLLKTNLLIAIAFLTWGIGFAMWKVPRDMHFANLTKTEKRGAQYGMDMEVKYLGQTIGPIIAGFLLLKLKFNGVLGFYILGLLLVIMLALFIKERNHMVNRSIYKTVNFHSLKEEFKELKFLGVFGVALFAVALLFTAWEQILLTLQPLFYGPDVLNIPSTLGGLLMASFSLPGILLSYFNGLIADKIRKKRALLIGLLVMGASLVGFSYSQNLYAVFLFALATSCGWAFSLPALNSMIVDVSGDHTKGKLVGLWDLFLNIGFIAGPITGGFIAEMYGIRSTFLILGIVFILTFMFFFFVNPKRKVMYK